jgi:hypothetical protein
MSTPSDVARIRDLNKQLYDLNKRLAQLQRVAEAAQKQAEALQERLAFSHDPEAIRARWRMTAPILQGHVLLAIGRFPSSDDAVEFEAPDWRLLASVRNILQTAERRLAELATPDASVVDEGAV